MLSKEFADIADKSYIFRI